MQDVTGKPVDPSWAEPLWTEERIGEYTSEVLAREPHHTPGGLVRRVAYAMQAEYERDRANFQAIYEQYISKPDSDDADRARLVAQVEQLQAELAALRGDDWGKTADYLMSLAPEPEPPLPEPPDDWGEDDEEDKPHYDTPAALTYDIVTAIRRVCDIAEAFSDQPNGFGYADAEAVREWVTEYWAQTHQTGVDHE